MNCKCKEPFFQGYDDAPKSIVCRICEKPPSKKSLSQLLKKNSKAKANQKLLKANMLKTNSKHRSAKVFANENRLGKKVAYKP